MPSPGGAKRVSTIPSYQEIYREMGLSPQRAEERGAAADSYLVEEVRVDDRPAESSSGGGRGSGASPSRDCQARPPTTHFGHARRARGGPADGIEEGKELYTRRDLSLLGGHLHENMDVHGNMREGCDSLVLGCLVSVL